MIFATGGWRGAPAPAYSASFNSHTEALYAAAVGGARPAKRVIRSFVTVREKSIEVAGRYVSELAIPLSTISVAGPRPGWGRLGRVRNGDTPRGNAS